MEAALGVPVLRHAEKKPGGSAESLTTYFGYACMPCANIERAVCRSQLLAGAKTCQRRNLTATSWSTTCNRQLENNIPKRI